MFRMLLILTVLGFLSAALAGCHADVGGGIGQTQIAPAR